MNASVGLTARRESADFHALASAALVLPACLLLGVLASRGGTFRYALVAAMAVLAVGILAVRPWALMYLLVIWAVALGFLRRVLSYDLLGSAPHADALLLVLPIMLILLTVAAINFGALRRRTALANGVLVLTCVILIGAVNPDQVNLTAGVAALLFFVPVTAFWIGRVISDRALTRTLILVALIAIPATAYGLFQVSLGFPSWDAAWAASQGYASLHVGSVIRAFSSFSAASEYATFLAVGVAVWLWLRKRRLLRPVPLVVIGLLLVGLVFESARSVIFTLVGTAGLVFAARRRLPLAVVPVTVALAVVLLPFVVSHVASTPNPNVQATGTQALVAHQIGGLGNPTGSSSTLGSHLSLVGEGLKSGFSHPLGQGLSVVTVAAAKFGGTVAGTEDDISNAAVAMGLPGLIAFLFVLLQGFTRGYRVAVARRDPLALTALAVLGVTVFQWLNGGQYAVAFLPWLALGWIDARSRELELPRTDGDAPHQLVEEAVTSRRASS